MKSAKRPSDTITEFLREAYRTRSERRNPALYKSGKGILTLPPKQQADVALKGLAQQVATLKRLVPGETSFYFDKRILALQRLLVALFRKNLPFEKKSLLHALERLAAAADLTHLPVAGILAAVENHAAAHGLPRSFRAPLKMLVRNLREGYKYGYAHTSKTLKSIAAILKPPVPADAVQFTTGEPWTLCLVRALEGMAPPHRAHWDTLLIHCASARGAKPSRKWLQQAEMLVHHIGEAKFAFVVVATLAELGKAGPRPKRRFDGCGYDVTQVHDVHADLLRGLIWSAAGVAREDLIRALGDAAAVCFTKIPDIGPRAPRVGNACLLSLATSASPSALVQLACLESSAKHRATRKQIRRVRALRAKNGCDASWQTSTVLAIARGIDIDRAFDRLPILADALEEAGLTSTAMLQHCRQPVKRKRGSWVVDLILGNELPKTRSPLINS